MAAKTVFISSTFKDLAEHRRAIWETLQQFDVDVRGMEQFGARHDGPLLTCLAEVAQSDVYVGIIAFRLGSIDQESGKSFTQLEYEQALATGKTVLIYLADEEAALFPAIYVDRDSRNQPRLAAFKERLREKHTVETFTTPGDLAEKLKRDFGRHFPPKDPEPATDATEEHTAKASRILQGFRLTPFRFNGQQVQVTVKFSGSHFAASRTLCRQFNLQYGDTVGAYVRITQPSDITLVRGLDELYATAGGVEEFMDLVRGKGTVDVVARLQFSEEDVPNSHARFFGVSIDPWEQDQPDDGSIWIPGEGKVILLFSRSA